MMAGVGHLTDARQEFQAQVPVWLPLDPDFVVVAKILVIYQSLMVVEINQCRIELEQYLVEKIPQVLI